LKAKIRAVQEVSTLKDALFLDVMAFLSSKLLPQIKKYMTWIEYLDVPGS